MYFLQEFLNHEFSAENITFWTSTEHYRYLMSDSARHAAAVAIMDRHLAPGCPEPVNVDSAARQMARDGMADTGPNIFAPAQKHIYNLMKFDSYTRYIIYDVYVYISKCYETALY
jgi:regulator of G-protein signaling